MGGGGGGGLMAAYPVSYPNNSPGGQFPTVQVLVLMSGFIPW